MKKNKFTKVVLAYCSGLSLAVLALYGILALMPTPEVTSTSDADGIRTIRMRVHKPVKGS